MSYTILPGCSQLQTRDGWFSADLLSASHEIFGIDRFGQMSPSTVATSAERPAAGIYIGTKTSFGLFAPGSVLLSAGGRRIKVSSLIEQTTVTDYSFECVLHQPDLENGARATSFWRDVRSVAVASSEEVSLFGKQSTDGELVSIGRSRLSDGSRFWRDVADALEARDGQPGELAFQRKELPLLLWYLSSLSQSDTSYSLTYDSIQHTTSVTVKRSSVHAPRDFRGACAFRSASSSPMTRLTWNDSSWNPIACGFVVQRTAS